VNSACVFSTILKTAQVQSIELPAQRRHDNLTLDEDLESLVLRVFPNLRGSVMCYRLTEKIQGSKSLIDWFHSVNIVPKPHAEVVVLEWFWRQDFCFVNDDRYIACSKPSCHCCALFFKYHPGHLLPRRSHGNIWVQWCVPRWENSVTSESSNLGVLRRITDATRIMTQASFSSGSVRRETFESTIGITTARL
jgi:hypothetical protein